MQPRYKFPYLTPVSHTEPQATRLNSIFAARPQQFSAQHQPSLDARVARTSTPHMHKRLMKVPVVQTTTVQKSRKQFKICRNLVIRAVSSKLLVMPSTHKKSRMGWHKSVPQFPNMPSVGRIVPRDSLEIVWGNKCNVTNRGIHLRDVKLLRDRRNDIGIGIKVVGVQNSNNFSRCHRDPFVHRIVESAIRLRNSLRHVGKAVDDFARAIGRVAVDNDVFDFGVRLKGHALKARRDDVGAVAAHGNDRYCCHRKPIRCDLLALPASILFVCAPIS